MLHLHCQPPVYPFSLVLKIGSISVSLATWIDMFFKGWENVMVDLSLKNPYKKLSSELCVCHGNFHLDKIHKVV